MAGEYKTIIFGVEDDFKDAMHRLSVQQNTNSIKFKKSEVRYKQCDGDTGVLFFSLRQYLSSPTKD